MWDSRRLDINSAMLRQALRAYEMDTVRKVGSGWPKGGLGPGLSPKLEDQATVRVGD